MTARRRSVSWPTRLRRLAVALAPMLAAAAVVAAAMAVRVATPIELDILVRAVAFTVAGDRPVPVLNNSTVFASLAIEDCDIVSFPPLTVSLEPASAVDVPRRVSFKCDAGVPGSKVVIRQSGGELGNLGRILAEPGDRVALDLAGAEPPAIRVAMSRNVSLEFSLMRDTPFEITTEFATVEGMPPSADPDGVVTYHAVTAGTERLASAESGQGLNMVLEFPPAKSAGLFRADVDIPVESVSLFQYSVPDDAFVSTAIEGILRYPGRPETENVPIAAGDSVKFRTASASRVTGLRVDPAKSGLWLRLDGEATALSVADQDRRLTFFDRVVSDRNSSLLGIVAVLASQLVWLRRFLWPASGAEEK